MVNQTMTPPVAAMLTITALSKAKGTSHSLVSSWCCSEAMVRSCLLWGQINAAVLALSYFKPYASR